MQPIDFPGRDIVLGAPEGWDESQRGPCAGLPVMRRDGVCVSMWRPSWRERLRLLFGCVIALNVVSGRSQPPVALEVGPLPSKPAE